jgi:acyl carrier protein
VRNDVRQSVLAVMRARGEIPGGTEEEQLAYWYLDEGLVDSMGFVELVLELEERFGIRFAPDDMQAAEFRTVGGVIGTVERLVAEED